MPTVTATDVHTRYQEVRSQTQLICKPLQPEDYVVQPVVDVSPPKWHLAHTTWFFETFLLQKFDPDYELFDKDYGYLFNSYYESEGVRVLRADRGNMSRPVVADIYAYRKYVDQAMFKLFQQPEKQGEDFRTVLEIGLHHEQQHQELLITDLKYILGHNPVFPAYFKGKNAPKCNEVRPMAMLEVPEGIYKIGHEQQGFCFDNELGSHKVYLPAFKVMDRLIINSEYLEFIEAGGYQDFRYWLMEGWEWVKAENINAPLYWHLKDGEWFYYNLYGYKRIDENAPVTHVSYYEADAYARWRGLRLPTEFEWETACKLHQPLIPSNAQFQDTGSYLPTTCVQGSYQFYGYTWEWTGSPYRPYPYYRQAEGALGEYNGKFMINQMVLRGGSCATPRNHIRSSYRNFFHPHLRWQFTGIRLGAHL